MNQFETNKISYTNTQHLWFCIFLFVIISALVDWFDPRLISIGRFSADSGILLAPITFLLGSILTEVYGFVYARKAIYYSLLFNLIFIAYGQLIIHLPGPNSYSFNPIFDKLFAFNIRIIIASVLTYFVSEILNAYLTSRLKVLFNNRHLLLRFFIAAIIAVGVDSFMFSIIAFYKIVPNQQLLQIIFLAWIVMGTINILGLPIAALVSKKLKQNLIP
ncbi:MAG: queuosine precursor transporter [Gammaproteobacteria bacterium]|nr:queuosine precursor transporter [Gammaproteobacteria bacterium]